MANGMGLLLELKWYLGGGDSNTSISSKKGYTSGNIELDPSSVE